MAIANLTGAPERVVDHPTPPTRRIVPALVDGAPLLLECPGWCTLDHVRADETTLDEVYHSGESADLLTPDTGIVGAAQLMLFAQLNEDPWSGRKDLRGPAVVVNAGGDDARLNAAQAMEYADGLEAFAAQVRAMARLAASEVA
jgi:hypothetical protein